MAEESPPVGESPTAEPPPSPSGEPGTLHLYLGDLDPPTMDPSAAEDSQSISVLTAVHRGLLYWTPELGVEPAWAEAMPVANEDFTEFTFTLREDAVYSDGSPILAEDFVYSIRRLVTPSLANPYGYLGCYISGVETLLASCGAEADGPDEDVENIAVTAPDERTLTITLNTPATFFLSIMAMWPMVPLKQSWVETAPFGEAAGYLSSGPFVLTQWDHNSLMVLAPNEAWPFPHTGTTVEFQIGGDPDAALAAYEQGNLDTVPVPATQLRRVKDDPAYADQINESAQLAITYYGFATCQEPPEQCPESTGTADGRSPTSNLAFRQALTHAVDKQQFIDLTFAGTGQIANSMVMPGLLGYDPDYNPYPFDLALATTAMETALGELGATDVDGDEAVTAADLGTLTFGYNSNAGHLPRVVFLAEAWRNAFGMTEDQFDLIGTDFATFLQERGEGKYAISRNGWGADFPHPHNQLNDLFRCNGTNNDEQWCNPAFDELMDQGAAEPDQAISAQHYIDGQRLMLDDAPIIPLRFGLTTYLIQPWVSGLVSTPNNHQNAGDSFYERITIAPH